MTPEGLETVIEVKTESGEIVRRILGPYPIHSPDISTLLEPPAAPGVIPPLSRDEILALVEEGKEVAKEVRRRIAPMLDITYEDLHRKMK